MRGKKGFFINLETLSRPPMYSNEEDLKTINFLNQAMNNPDAFHNMPQEAALELMSQMDIQQIIDNIDAHKMSLDLYEKINAHANQYFTTDPARELKYRLAKESILHHESTLSPPVLRSKLGEAIRTESGFNDPVNFSKTIVANYEDIQEIVKLSSQLIEKLNQSLRLLATVQDEQSFRNNFGM